ncbi:MAG TPA: histidine kinase [Mucilaginibacter sp.]|jgi:hypothetical protein
MSFFEKAIEYNKRYRALSHVAFWAIVLLLQLRSSSYHNSESVPFKYNLVGDGMNLLAQIAAAYLLAYFIVPNFFYKQKYVQAFIYFFIVAYVICVLSRIEVIHVEEPFHGDRRNPSETFTEILTDIPKLVYVYFFRVFSVAFVFTFLKLLKDQQDIQKRALSLEKEKAETELKFLKAQLNPHFLFNTLNNIYSLSLSHSAATSESIGRLSEILDHILYRCNNLFVPLSTEINLINNYIGLEKLRYDERLKVSFDTSLEHDIEIAPLILLSIVENAFKHGAGEDAGDSEIDIDLKVNDLNFWFSVKNSYSGNVDTNQNEKIGLSNLKHQLDLIYPEKYKLDIKQTELLFEVLLTIDLKPEKANRYENTMLVG